MAQQGVFIVVDGPNGVGKTTAVGLMQTQPTLFPLPTCYTKEPTGSELGKFIRSQLDAYSAETLACLVAANRYEHIREVIVPNLRQGRLVVSDRFITSSLVYQGMDGLSDEFILSLNSRIIIPDLTIILVADESTLNKRIAKRLGKITRFEELDKRSLEISRYYSAANTLALNGYKIELIDTSSLSIEETVEKLINQVHQALKNSHEKGLNY